MTGIEIGTRFGRLVILDNIVIHNKKHRHCCKCLCDCGNIKTIRADALKSKHTISCGCYNNECAGNRMRKPEGESSWTAYFGNYKNSAYQRNIKFNVTLETFKIICSKNCHYCGEAPIQYNHNLNKKGELYERSEATTKKQIDISWIFVNGVDRLDNEIGYIENNLVPCCSTCNYMKRMMEAEEFILHCRKVGEFKHV
jgi:hypothetical protein